MLALVRGSKSLGSNALLIAAIVIIGLVGLAFLMVGGRIGSADGSGPLAAIRSVIDESIGMVMVRRLRGRRTVAPPVADPPAELLSAWEIAHRIGAVDVAALDVSGARGSEVGSAAGGAAAASSAGNAVPVAALAAPVDDDALSADQIAIRIGARTSVASGAGSGAGPASVRGRLDAEPSVSGVVTPRRRLLRDTGAALVALAAVALVAVLVTPGGAGGRPTGTIQSVVLANRSADPTESSAPQATFPPDASVTPATTPKPSDTPVGDDTIAPAVGGPDEAFSAQTVGPSTTLVRISWSGSDPGSGIARYELEVSVNGSAFTKVSLASATATSTTRTHADGRSYRYRVRATDRQGNVGAWVAGAAFESGRYQNSSPSVAYSSGWSTLPNTRALGGSHRHASTRGSRVSITSVVRDFAWVTTRTTTSGSAQVWVDGVLAATINTRSSTTSYRQLMFARHFSGLTSHKIEIRPIGNGRVYLDAFLVMR